MDERDGVEWPEQQFQHRQSSVKKNKSEIKQEKKMSKTESRFRSKLESLKKFQHSASTNSAVERARAFFRSLELKHLGSSSSNSDHSSSSSSRRRNTSTTTTTSHDVPLSPPCSKVLHPSSVSSSSSSSIIDDSHNTISTTTNDSLLYKKSVPSSNCIATARIIRVVNPNYSNSKDIIVHRVKNTEQDADHHHHFTSSYLNHHQQPQQNYHTSKQYYNNERSQSYSISFEKHRDIQTQYNSRPLSPASTINPNITYASQIYPKFSPSSSTHSNITNGNISDHRMSVSLYNYRPLVCRQMESSSLMSSSFHEQSDRLHDSIIRPLPTSASSSSMSTWTQSVRRLNSEYTSTINALQQAKDSLKQIYPPPPPLQSTDNISKYASFVAQGINNLSNNQTKKSLGVTFCLTTPISQNASLSVSEIPKSPSTSVFSKPKLVRPLELDTFIPSIPPIPKLEPIPIINEINDKGDSIANIIKKFNNLNHSSVASSTTTSLKSSIIIDNDNNNDTLSSQNNQEKRDNVSKPIIYDSFQPKKDQTNIPSTLSDLHIHTSNSSPRVRFEPSVTTYELEEIPYESPPPPLSSSSSSSSSSLASEDSTSSTSSSSDDNQINGNHSFDHHHYNNNYNNNNYNQEETTYTVETFYKKKEDNKIHIPANHQQVVIIRENTTEEQFNLAQEKQQISSETNFQTNQTNISSLNPPLLTYLNLAVNQTTPTPPTLEKQEKIHDNYHSVEPSSHITNDLISDINHNEDDEIINDVVTINPYTDSPPSHRLNSSSSSTDTTSSASTVLLSSNTKSTRPVSSTVTQTPSSSSSSVSNTNGSLNKNNQKPNSQLPKRTTTISSSTTASNISRLKQPSKSVPSPSKLKPPSSTSSSSNIVKPTKSMIVNSTSTSMRKPTGIMNQSTTMTNNSVNKTFQQESSSSSSILPSGKKQQLLNGTNMTESQTPTDSSSSMGKSRVRSMVNQFNAAVSSTSRPTIPTTVSAKRIPVTTTTSTINAGVSTVNNTRRPMSMEPTSTNKTTITSSSSNRPSLQRAMTISNQSPATSSPPSTPPSIHNNNNVPSSYKRRAPLIRSTSNVKEGLLRWCQVQVDGYPNVSVTNLSSSWSDGLAFCALTHHFFPDAFDFKSLSSTNRKENFELAFRVAEERAGVPQLLDVSDMLIMGNTPDYKCIFTYLNSFLAKVKDIHPTTNGIQNH